MARRLEAHQTARSTAARSSGSKPRARASCCCTTSSRATALGLPALLRELKARGYRIVHVVPATPELPVYAIRNAGMGFPRAEQDAAACLDHGRHPEPERKSARTAQDERDRFLRRESDDTASTGRPQARFAPASSRGGENHARGRKAAARSQGRTRKATTRGLGHDHADRLSLIFFRHHPNSSGAVERTPTSTSCPTATSRQRVTNSATTAKNVG